MTGAAEEENADEGDGFKMRVVRRGWGCWAGEEGSVVGDEEVADPDPVWRRRRPTHTKFTNMINHGAVRQQFQGIIVVDETTPHQAEQKKTRTLVVLNVLGCKKRRES